MRERRCVHVRTGELAAYGGAVVSIQPPDQPPDVATAQLCPLCLGYLLGVIAKLEESGLKELAAEQKGGVG